MLFHKRSCRILISHEMNHLSRWSDELDSFLFAFSCKICIFRKKSVAWMNRIAVIFFCCCQDSIFIKITLLSRCRSNAYRICRKLHWQAVLILGRIDENRFNSHLPATAQYSHGNLATVCYQNSFEHFI